MKRVLVCGGRKYTDQRVLWRTLDKYHARHGISVIIHGAAKGADTMAQRWAARHGVPNEPYPADWETQGTRAGPLRNKKMLLVGMPDEVIAFPGGSGTANMVAQALAASISVLNYNLRPYHA